MSFFFVVWKRSVFRLFIVCIPTINRLFSVWCIGISVGYNRDHKPTAKGLFFMWKLYNPNPTGRNVEDCSVRAVSKALDTDWEHAYAMLSASGYQMGDMPHSNSVISALLRKHNFYRTSLPNTCPDCYTAEDFAREHPHGVYVLGFGRHVATVADGDIYDSWDSSKEIPQYYWFKKEEE